MQITKKGDYRPDWQEAEDRPEAPPDLPDTKAPPRPPGQRGAVAAGADADDGEEWEEGVRSPDLFTLAMIPVTAGKNTASR